jgi:hypothetical protein
MNGVEIEEAISALDLFPAQQCPRFSSLKIDN